MRSVLLIFAAVALIVALLSLLTAPPLEIVVEPPNGTTRFVGGPYDTGPEGASLAYGLVERLGYKVETSPEAPYDGVLAIVTDSSVATGDWAGRLLEAVQESRKHYALVIAPGYILEELISRLEISVRMIRAPAGADRDLRLALTSNGSIWYSIRHPGEGVGFQPAGARVVAEAVPGGEPLAIIVQSRGVRLLLYLAPRNGVAGARTGYFSEFSNQGIRIGAEAGLDPEAYLAGLLELAGASPGDVLLAPEGVAYKTVPLPGAEPIRLHVNTRAVAARLLEGLVEEERDFLRGLWENPRSLAIAGLLLAAAMLPAGRRLARGLAGEVGEDEPLTAHEPIEGTGLSAAYAEAARIAREGRLGKHGARRLLRALYEATDYLLGERIGGGVREVLRDPRLLREASLRSGIPPERLEALLRRLELLYTRKVARRSLFPLVNLEKEARGLLEGLRPLLEGLGLEQGARSRGAEKDGSGEG